MKQQELKNKHIGVLMGGLSRERDISLRSGANCQAALDRLGYQTVAVDVGHDVAEALHREGVEVAFLALHGRYGEDGSLQGLLEVLGLPYTGSRVLASAMGMNKVRTKQVAAAYGIATPHFAIFTRGPQLHAEVRRVASELSFPVMVKPSEEGSSIGVSLIEEPDMLEQAVADTCSEYDMVLAEEFISGTEVTVGLLENAEGLQALPVLQLVPRSTFYDFHAKYNHGMTEFILPADLPEEVTARVQELAGRVHTALGCRGFSRVDFIIDGDGRPQLTEINTLPGMTDTSDLPAQARAAGIGYDELVERMLASCLLP